MRKAFFFFAILSVAGLPAFADTLSDVRAAVSRMTAKQPVRATFATQQHVKSEGKFANDNVARSVSAEVAHDATGISITVPQALLDRVTRARGNGEEAAQNLIGAIRTIEVADALDFRDTFLVLTRDATVAREDRFPFNGHPTRRLTLKLKPHPARDAGKITIGTVKTEDEMRLWVGDDNIPIAADRAQSSSAGVLFMKGTYIGKMSYTFVRSGDRLMIARLETADTGSGMGQNVEKTTVQTLTIR